MVNSFPVQQLRISFALLPCPHLFKLPLQSVMVDTLLENQFQDMHDLQWIAYPVMLTGCTVRRRRLR